MTGALFVTTLIAALGCALAAGALFAFSSFVMAGLDRLPPAGAAAAMQAINVMAPTPAFMTALFGSGALAIAAAIWALVSEGGEAGALAAAGAAVYVVGVCVVTMVANVPRNNRLATLDPDGAEAAAYWSEYRREWTAWNHVRVATGIAGAGLLVLALAA
jgi:uncharacterized membrane protein